MEIAFSNPNKRQQNVSKNIKHQEMHKGFFFITCNTRLHVSTLLGHRQGELSAVVTLCLHFIIELLIVYCVAFWRGELSKPRPQSSP
jgi:hypothetical protein